MTEWVYAVWRCKACKWDNVMEYTRHCHDNYFTRKDGKTVLIDCMNKASCGEKKKAFFLKFIDERTAWDFYYPNGDNPFPWDEWKVLEAAVAAWKTEFADWDPQFNKKTGKYDNPHPWYPAHKLNDYRKSKVNGPET